MRTGMVADLCKYKLYVIIIIKFWPNYVSQILLKFSNIKFHENPFRISRISLNLQEVTQPTGRVILLGSPPRVNGT